MQKKLLIDASHQEETRIVLLDRDQVEEFDFESGQKKQQAGNIFLAKVTRVEPSLQAAFLDYGGNRHGFLAFSEIHPDYYQIPVADKEALLAEERELEKRSDDYLDNDIDNELNDTRLPAYAELKEDSSEIIKSDHLDLEENNLSLDDFHPEKKKKLKKSGTAPVDNSPGNEDTVVSSDETDQSLGSDSKEKNTKPLKPKKKFRNNRYKIQEVIKVRQVLLIQVVKDERGNKGAALTTYISLAGRYCVLMPNTARGGGISRKITNMGDRKKLKETASEFSIPDKMGLIIRTAGAKRTKTEIKRDFEYLLRQWEQIRDLTLKSIAPCPIYEEGSVIKRSIRDLYTKEINEIIVEGEIGFKEAKDYMKMLMPSHAKKIKTHEKTQPIFSYYGVENYLSAMFNPTVQLKSGGYIVIGITEALVAIDVNSGRSTKESGIEATALRTNLEAADEIARQFRMRDLAGLIVIDFIDMEEKKNNISVERKMRDSLKLDRARIQVGRISSFGLLEMSRQRLRYGMIEATTKPCSNCHGTGLTRSNENLALEILRSLEAKKPHSGATEAVVKAPVEVANYLLNQKRRTLEMIEKRLRINIAIHADTSINNPNFVFEIIKSPGTLDETHSGKVITIDGAKNAPKEENGSANNNEPSHGNPVEQAGRKPKRRRRRNNKSKHIDSEMAASAILDQNNSKSLEKISKATDPLQEGSSLEKEQKLDSRKVSEDKKSVSGKENAQKVNENLTKEVSTDTAMKQPKRRPIQRNKVQEKQKQVSVEKISTTVKAANGSVKTAAKKRIAKPVNEVLKENETKSELKSIKEGKETPTKNEKGSRTGWLSRNKSQDDG